MACESCFRYAGCCRFLALGKVRRLRASLSSPLSLFSNDAYWYATKTKEWSPNPCKKDTYRNDMKTMTIFVLLLLLCAASCLSWFCDVFLAMKAFQHDPYQLMPPNKVWVLASNIYHFRMNERHTWRSLFLAWYSTEELQVQNYDGNLNLSLPSISCNILGRTIDIMKNYRAK